MGERIGRILRGQIVTSLIYVLLGLCLICMPVESVNLICKLVFGIIMIVAGLYHVLIYVLEKMNATVLDLFSGAILVVLGGFLFFNPQVVIKLLPILLGAFVLIDSIWSLKGAFRLKKRGHGGWKILLLGSLIFIGLGIAMIINPFKVVKYTIMFAGWTLLCNGVADIVFMILIRVGMKEARHAAETVESEPEEASEEKEEDRAPRWSFLNRDRTEKEQESGEENEVQTAQESQKSQEAQPAQESKTLQEISASEAEEAENTAAEVKERESLQANMSTGIVTDSSKKDSAEG